MHIVSNNTTYNETPTLCNDTADSIMCLYKYEGNLTINNGVKVTPQVRKKGFGIYVDGTLKNNGEISMTARGASAEGQDVVLYANKNGTNETVPAIGGAGGELVYQNADATSNGLGGVSGTNRKTGGGGSGAANSYSRYKEAYSGAGGTGTSYSGGTGGGGSHVGHCSRGYAAAGATFGGAGGIGYSCPYNTGYSYTEFIAGGGAGNPGGIGSRSSFFNTEYTTNVQFATAKGEDGTGGLLIIYATNIENANSITSNGSLGGGAGIAGATGGSSGGGSVNIFYKKNYSNASTIEAKGGAAVVGTRGNSGAGGNGSVIICSIETGNCVK